MSDEPAQELIDTLTSDLAPVEPIPSLRRVAGGVIALWLVVAAIGLLLMGVRPDLLAALSSPFGPGGIFAGLAAAGVGGLVAALALSVPGRESTARAGFVLASVGLAYAAGVGTFLFSQSPSLTTTTDWTADLRCLGISCAVGLLPAVGVVLFSARAQVFRPLALVVAAAAGAAALGAVTAQANCPANDARHLMLGHILAPGVGALVLSLPLLVALRRSRRS